ncbi:hypothetical protein L1987_14892 [Smallanthus sonchifolius]|uniref:Uncharacterized protein n=1 Tax=Smallanthus sonchifolius TaxID=185202 RepID=A0ACB9J686_9ASTR|nr:hypothetical protein L1987_14892 [Smallanthus sonchifolius]
MAPELHLPPDRFRRQPELPPEITLFQILPRLPAKSVIRFKSVSKQWHAFLTTPMFKNLHLQHINKDNHQNPNKLLLSTTTEPYKFYTIDCEAPKDGLTTCPSLPFETKRKQIEVLTSFHGLVCVGMKDTFHNEYSDLILWNPLTREYRTLSKGNHHKIRPGRAFSLYYTSSDDDYKLVHVTHDVYIYSLRSDSWSTVGYSQYIQRMPNCLSERWFDTKTEKFTKISIPSFKSMWACILSFSVVRGCIHVCAAYNGCKMKYLREMEMWRMDGDGEWTKVVTYSEKWWFEKGPVHMMRNGNWMMHSEYDGYFCQIDMEKNVKDVLCSGRDVILNGTLFSSGSVVLIANPSVTILYRICCTDMMDSDDSDSYDADEEYWVDEELEFKMLCGIVVKGIIISLRFKTKDTENANCFERWF